VKVRPIIFDLEIVKAIRSAKEKPIPGIEYCRGWGDHAGMGISVLCAVDDVSQRTFCLCKDNGPSEMQKFIDDKETLFVSFNGFNFDAKVVLASWGIQIPEERHYDILRELWTASGLGPSFNPKTHGGFGLDAACIANNHGGKSGNGALAPVNWQRGNVGDVINYCLHDVWLTQMLFNKIIFTGYLTCPKTGNRLTMRRPALPKAGESLAA
jgi:hypothetical protein